MLKIYGYMLGCWVRTDTVWVATKTLFRLCCEHKNNATTNPAMLLPAPRKTSGTWQGPSESPKRYNLSSVFSDCIWFFCQKAVCCFLIMRSESNLASNLVAAIIESFGWREWVGGRGFPSLIYPYAALLCRKGCTPQITRIRRKDCRQIYIKTPPRTSVNHFSSDFLQKIGIMHCCIYSAEIPLTISTNCKEVPGVLTSTNIYRFCSSEYLCR